MNENECLMIINMKENRKWHALLAINKGLNLKSGNMNGIYMPVHRNEGSHWFRLLMIRRKNDWHFRAR